MLRLELNFLNHEDKRVRLTLNDATPDLTGPQVKTAMEGLIAADVFNFVEIHSARYVTTTVDDIPVEG